MFVFHNKKNHVNVGSNFPLVPIVNSSSHIIDVTSENRTHRSTSPHHLIRQDMHRAARSLRNMAPKRINLILDWDGTITTKDTMFAYGKIADIRDVRLGKKPTGTESFGAFGQAWMDDYAAHEAAYTPKAGDRSQPAQESAWLKSLSAVEGKSAKRVEDSSFFAGVTRLDVVNAARELLADGKFALRAGWKDAFIKARLDSIGDGDQTSHFDISILSVNWSEAFIRASLIEAAGNLRSSNESNLKDFIEALPVAANEVSGLDNPDGSAGILTDPSHAIIRTSFDKVQNLKTQQGSYNVYVGDSTTDFDCLINADVGICIRDEPMGSSARALAETLSRLGYNVRHVSELARWQELNTQGSILLWARDFNEILSLFSRLQGQATESEANG